MFAKADGEPHIDSDVDKDKAEEEDLVDDYLAADKKEKNEEKAFAAEAEEKLKA